MHANPISRRLLLAGGANLAALPLLGCGSLSTSKDSDSSFSRWAEAFCADRMRRSPQMATQLQYFDGTEQDALDAQLRSEAQGPRAERLGFNRQALERLAGIDTGRLNSAERIDAALLRWCLEEERDGAPFDAHDFVFQHREGLHVAAINLLTQVHPMRRTSDIDSWLARLALLPRRLDEALERGRAAASHGLLPPRFIVERSLTQLRSFLAPPARDNLLLRSLAERSGRIAELPAARRQAALKQAEALLDGSVRPAYARVQAWLEALQPRCGDDAGLWRLPLGEAAYAHELKRHTTMEIGVREVHDLGLREVARIEAEMDRLLRQLGRSSGSVHQRFNALQADEQPPAVPDPRPQLLARYEAYIRESERLSAPLFGLRPRAPVVVEREPALTEATAAASYHTPAPDGTRPGVFRAPLPGPIFPVLGMKSLTIHEAVPGHHFQLALQQEMPGLPRWRQRRVYGGGSAYIEGWSLYAEALAIEQGWYADDPKSLLGALDMQLFRARRLVVDTGLHAYRWTRQQAIDYGIPPQEVDRYVVWPGQACSYTIGMLEILRMRDAARQTLGARFTMPAFHDEVLKPGSVPLAVLGQHLKQWSLAGAA